MHIILTGATGTCGAAVLQHCLVTPTITRLTLLSRRPIPQAAQHDKVSVIVHEDFTQYPQSLLDQLKGAEACIWALGVSSNSVSKPEYIKITHDYSLAAAKAFAGLSDPFKFVFVSGEGADPTEKSFSFFGKIKGRTEKGLHALASSAPSLRTYVVRPGYIDPEGEILRERPRSMTEMVSAGLAPVMRRAVKSLIIGTRPLARVLTDLAIGDGEPVQGSGVEEGGRTLRNTAARRMAGV